MLRLYQEAKVIIVFIHFMAKCEPHVVGIVLVLREAAEVFVEIVVDGPLAIDH